MTRSPKRSRWQQQWLGRGICNARCACHRRLQLEKFVQFKNKNEIDAGMVTPGQPEGLKRINRQNPQ